MNEGYCEITEGRDRMTIPGAEILDDLSSPILFSLLYVHTLNISISQKRHLRMKKVTNNLHYIHDILEKYNYLPPS